MSSKHATAPAHPAEPDTAISKIFEHLGSLLTDQATDARTIVNYVVGSVCGISNTLFKDTYYSTTFLTAVEANRLDVVQLLLAEHSPNINAVCQGGMLTQAAAKNNSELVRCLVSQGVNVDVVVENGAIVDGSISDSYGHTPLFYALKNGHSSMALLLLELGADPNLTNKLQQSTIHWACSLGMVDVVRAMIAKGVSISATDFDGKTPLFTAVSWGGISLVLYLLELGADPNIVDRNQITPLHSACQSGLTDVARALLANGADASMVDPTGKTPLDYAESRDRFEIIALLKGEISD